jgi:hypothetical protein
VGDFPLLNEASGGEIGVEVGFGVIVGEQLMELAAFLVQPERPAFSNLDFQQLRRER